MCASECITSNNCGRIVIKSGKGRKEGDSANAIKTTEGLIILWSFSGETEIIIIAISHIDTSEHVLVDYGNGKNR